MMVKEDHYMYVKWSTNKFLILSLFVDDNSLAKNGKEMILATKGWLSSTFEMDIGKANYMLGVKIWGIVQGNFSIYLNRII